MLLELELPRLLAPDLPSNRSSLKGLNCTHSDDGPHREPSRYFSSLPPRTESGEFARLLPSLDVVAISQAPSPESNPYSPLPVTTMVGT